MNRARGALEEKGRGTGAGPPNTIGVPGEHVA